MGRIWKALLAGAVAMVATVAMSAPTVAGAQEDTRSDTLLVGGSFVLSSNLHVLQASAALSPTQAPQAIRHGGETITFTSGGLLVCSAVTKENVFGDPDWGIARCSVNPLTPGGLRAVLTGSVQADFAGSATLKPSSATLQQIGPDAPPVCYDFFRCP